MLRAFHWSTPWLRLVSLVSLVTLDLVVFLTRTEFRELLDRLFSWCDLCLPANEQAFAESHRQKIQKFQMQIVQEMKRSNSARSQVRAHRSFTTLPSSSARTAYTAAIKSWL